MLSSPFLTATAMMATATTCDIWAAGGVRLGASETVPSRNVAREIKRVLELDRKLHSPISSR
jgi:hypothetical protein